MMSYYSVQLKLLIIRVYITEYGVQCCLSADYEHKSELTLNCLLVPSCLALMAKTFSNTAVWKHAANYSLDAIIVNFVTVSEILIFESDHGYRGKVGNQFSVR